MSVGKVGVVLFSSQFKHFFDTQGTSRGEDKLCGWAGKLGSQGLRKYIASKVLASLTDRQQTKSPSLGSLD